MQLSDFNNILKKDQKNIGYEIYLCSSLEYEKKNKEINHIPAINYFMNIKDNPSSKGDFIEYFEYCATQSLHDVIENYALAYEEVDDEVQHPITKAAKYFLDNIPLSSIEIKLINKNYGVLNFDQFKAALYYNNKEIALYDSGLSQFDNKTDDYYFDMSRITYLYMHKQATTLLSIALEGKN